MRSYTTEPLVQAHREQLSAASPLGISTRRTGSDRSRGGAGIGLAVFKQLIEATGGRVGVESGGGLTRFWFSLPT